LARFGTVVGLWSHAAASRSQVGGSRVG